MNEEVTLTDVPGVTFLWGYGVSENSLAAGIPNASAARYTTNDDNRGGMIPCSILRHVVMLMPRVCAICFWVRLCWRRRYFRLDRKFLFSSDNGFVFIISLLWMVFNMIT